MSVEAVTAYVMGDIAVILLISSLLGGLARRFGQPAVIGQILTGVVLGPTLLGRLPGHLTGRLFPPQVLPYLSVLAQVAIVTFMFVVGYELNLRALRKSSRTTLSVAAAALLVPMGLGAVAVLLMPSAFASVGEHDIGSRSFVLFMAVAVSITALPVLAAIVREAGFAGTRASLIALSAAGVMDVAAWTALAAAMPGGSHGLSAWLTAFLAAGLVLGGALLVRPLLRWWIHRPGSMFTHQLPMAIVLTMGCAWATSELGLHAVFGGILAGLLMPRRDDVPDADVLRAMEGASALLLPLFFVVTGLSLNIGAINRAGVLLLGLILMIAVAGKLVPGYLTSRLNGLDKRESATVAALLNTRGLTELIALNVGLSAGIIHERLFAVLVLMALITTATTSPLLTLLAVPRRPVSAPDEAVPSAGRKET
ncbi:transporter (CPA2 family) [Streptomyces puniciscabiei]|uniref:Transporter (CPA2 family) n=1 Tax=Streptomyces puniciscabiei TaxID=164348 RepID=A0A542UCN3_9ACTN|nr:cation:proton antiporter [Streptomyces puniciscabiei]TQK96796.1 transporter (CPA2 family) [Streptomyces puniciscabiei]